MKRDSLQIWRMRNAIGYMKCKAKGWRLLTCLVVVINAHDEGQNPAERERESERKWSTTCYNPEGKYTPSWGIKLPLLSVLRLSASRQRRESNFQLLKKQILPLLLQKRKYIITEMHINIITPWHGVSFVSDVTISKKQNTTWIYLSFSFWKKFCKKNAWYYFIKISFRQNLSIFFLVNSNNNETEYTSSTTFQNDSTVVVDCWIKMFNNKIAPPSGHYW